MQQKVEDKIHKKQLQETKTYIFSYKYKMYFYNQGYLHNWSSKNQIFSQ